MKFTQIATIALVAGVTTATDKKVAEVLCSSGVKYYSDKACKTEVTPAKDAAVKTAAAAVPAAIKLVCTKGKLSTAGAKTFPLDKCTKLGAAVGKGTYVMYMGPKKAGGEYLAAGAAAALALIATQF